MNKEREKLYAERFLVVMNLSNYNLINNEAPDFILKSQSHVICLEVTELFRTYEEGKPPRQAIENKRERIITLASSIWNQHHYPNLEISVSFPLSDSYPKTDILHLANQLVDIVSRNIPPTKSYNIIDAETEGNDFPEDIESISVWNLPIYNQCSWSASDVSLIPSIDKSLIQSSISKKQNADYRVGKSSETWLLIVADGARLSSNFDFPQFILEETYTTSFDKVYLFDTLRKRVQLLNTQKLSK
jgi:hypothetical protein